MLALRYRKIVCALPKDKYKHQSSHKPVDRSVPYSLVIIRDLPPAADGNKYRDLQPDSNRRVRNFRILNLNGMSPSNPFSQDSGEPLNRKQKECKSRKDEDTKKTRPSKSP